MARTTNLLYYIGHDWVKIGEVQVEEDGSLKGQITSDKLLGLPEMITKTGQPFVFALAMLPSGPAVSKF